MQQIEETYTLDDYIAAGRRRRRLFLLVAVPIVTIAIGLSLTLPDQFRSFARLGINLEGSNVQTLEPIQVAAYADQYVAELRDRVLSSENLLPFLQDSSVFPESEEEFPLSDRNSLVTSGFYFELSTQPVTSQTGREVDIISGAHVGFEGPDPEFAFKAARFLSESFLKEDRAIRTERAGSTAAFLNEQIAETDTQIVALEQEIADFKVENACCLPELKELNMAVIQRAERDIEVLRPRIRTLEQDRIFLQAQLEEIRKQSIATDRLALLEQEYVSLVANYGPDHPDVGRVRREIQAITAIGPSIEGDSELTILRIELAEAERRYTESHPDVLSLKRRIAALEGEKAAGKQTEPNRLLENPRYLQLRSEINAINTELAELRRRDPSLRQKIEDYEQRLRITPQIETEYQALNRKLEMAQKNFDNLQQRLVIAKQTKALESTEIGARLSEVRPSFLPRSPSGPPRLVIFIIGVFLAGSFGLGISIIAEMLDSTVRSSKDITRAVEMIPLATIPVIQNSTSIASSRRHLLFMALPLLAATIGLVYILVAGIA